MTLPNQALLVADTLLVTLTIILRARQIRLQRWKSQRRPEPQPIKRTAWEKAENAPLKSADVRGEIEGSLERAIATAKIDLLDDVDLSNTDRQQADEHLEIAVHELHLNDFEHASEELGKARGIIGKTLNYK
jgi:hypothetical protein